MYELIFDPKAIEFLEKSERQLAKRIWDKLMSTKENPHHFFERLSSRSDYKLRIGDYRAIADIDDNKKIIKITFVGHRKNVYQDI